MNEKKLLAISQEYHNRAEEVLTEFGIENLLGKHGKVVYTGAYSYGLMMSGDIDIHLVVDGLTKGKAKRLYLEILNSDNFHSTQFTDFFTEKHDNLEHRSRKGFPKGFYIGIRHFFTPDENWKVDLWLVEKEFDTEYDLVLKDITEKQRFEILKRKYERRMEKLNLSSSKIYDEVLKLKEV